MKLNKRCFNLHLKRSLPHIGNLHANETLNGSPKCNNCTISLQACMSSKLLSGNVRSRTSKRFKYVAYHGMLEEFDLVWCVKGLIVTCSNRNCYVEAPALNEHHFLISPQFVLRPWSGCIGFSCNCIIFFNLRPKRWINK